jgi:hypothetical protein
MPGSLFGAMAAVRLSAIAHIFAALSGDSRPIHVSNINKLGERIGDLSVFKGRWPRLARFGPRAARFIVTDIR